MVETQNTESSIVKKKEKGVVQIQSEKKLHSLLLCRLSLQVGDEVDTPDFFV